MVQKNIEAALKNTDRIEDIDEKAEVLAEGANRFKNAGTSLKRTMRCRYWKMMLTFSLLVIVIVIIIAVSLYYTYKK